MRMNKMEKKTYTRLYAQFELKSLIGSVIGTREGHNPVLNVIINKFNFERTIRVIDDRIVFFHQSLDELRLHCVLNKKIMNNTYPTFPKYLIHTTGKTIQGITITYQCWVLPMKSLCYPQEHDRFLFPLL